MIHWLLDTNAGLGVLTILVVVVASFATWAAFWAATIALLVGGRFAVRRLRRLGS